MAARPPDHLKARLAAYSNPAYAMPYRRTRRQSLRPDRRSCAHPGGWRWRVSVGHGRADRISPRNGDPVPEKTQRPMIWTRSARIEHAAIPLSVQLLTNGLERCPASATRDWNGQVNLGELGWSREVGDVADGDRPAPKVTWHPVGRGQRRLSK